MVDKEWQMNTALRKTERILDAVGAEMVTLHYMKVTEENRNQLFSAWEQEYHRILTGDELITVRNTGDGSLLYVVNVTGDSVLTAIAELWQLLAKKF